MDLNNSDNKELSDFSIDHILNKAGTSQNDIEKNPSASNLSNSDFYNHAIGNNFDFHLPWLNCTRYCPPKLPRHVKKEVPIAKRQLGRHPRIPFTSDQLGILEQKFKERPYISSDEVTVLSKALNLTDIRVKIWFQNRRARERREQLFPINTKESDRKNSSNFLGVTKNNEELPKFDENNFSSSESNDFFYYKENS